MVLNSLQKLCLNLVFYCLTLWLDVINVCLSVSKVSTSFVSCNKNNLVGGTFGCCQTQLSCSFPHNLRGDTRRVILFCLVKHLSKCLHSLCPWLRRFLRLKSNMSNLYRGAHVKNLWGVLATWDRLYTKTILRRHNATDTDLYFYPHR